MFYPYEEIRIKENELIKIFPIEKNSNEFSNHRDSQDRYLEIISGEGWKIQFNEEIPIELFKKDIIFIPKMTWHKIIKPKKIDQKNYLKVIIRFE